MGVWSKNKAYSAQGNAQKLQNIPGVINAT